MFTRPAHLLRMAVDPTGFLQRTAAEHGPLAPLHLGRGPVMLLTDPEATRTVLVDTRAFPKGMGSGMPGGEVGSTPLRAVLGNGLLTSRGEHHKRQRRLIQPAFHHQRIAVYATVMAEEAAAMTGGWVDRETVDVHAAFAETTLRVLARTVFDVSVSGGDTVMIRDAVNATMRGPGANVILVSFLRRLGQRALAARNEALAGVHTMIDRLIAERRADPSPGTDVLSWLIEARDGEDGGGMTDADMRDEMLTLLLAGHETSTNALSWAYHLLARSPDVLAALQAELDDVLDGGRVPTVEDLGRLHWTRAIVDESMRLYPPAWVMVRHASAETTLLDRTVPAGTTLLLSPWVVHRDPKSWRDADRFDPARWLTGPDGGYQPAPETRHAYFPFGGGPRMCIGNTFALMEIAMVLAHTSRHWTLTPPRGHRVRLQPRVTLRPRGGLPMVVHAR
jgi:cytochrome P450